MSFFEIIFRFWITKTNSTRSAKREKHRKMRETMQNGMRSIIRIGREAKMKIWNKMTSITTMAKKILHLAQERRKKNKVAPH